jgi:hypothetical protein
MAIRNIFYDHLVILWYFGIFSPVLVYCDKKNLATLKMTAPPAQVVAHYIYFGDHGGATL